VIKYSEYWEMHDKLPQSECDHDNAIPFISMNK